MTCASRCDPENIQYKEFQDLSDWESHTLEDLQSRLGEKYDEEVRVYTVATTKLDANKLIRHWGSGPNLEGGIATLCTCKHSMRRGYEAADWKDKWILGVTSRAIKNNFNQEHFLLYLMKIEQAFSSHYELYQYLQRNNASALKVKCAVKNRLGDIFEPLVDCADDPLNPRKYEFPHKDHSHGCEIGDGWENDISIKKNSSSERLPTPLLLGLIDNTFAWKRPTIKFNQKRGVGNMKLTLGTLFSDLLK